MTVEPPPLRARLAAQTVIEDLLDQRVVPTRSPLARLLGRSPLHGESLAVFHGAKDDISVAAALARIPAGWKVFHSLPVGKARSEIGHLVVGPNGVFTVTMRNARGQNIWVFKRLLLVAGRSVSYLRDAELEAERATRVLRKRMPQHHAVRPVIALVNPREVVIREKPSEVKVLNSRHLNAWLVRQPPVLNDRELVEIMTIVDDPKTWGAAPQVNAQEVMARFAALDGDVSISRRRRLWWTSWATVLVIAMVGVEAVVVLNVVTAMLADIGMQHPAGL
ncbi:nuclease-related domain-containing protein [Cryobacterium psychrophilum]|uniref:nuclease-related domain-containing protein n=1 Tax=Cryobacterium psychrophilum TaxID=41988 RepID=UPI0010D474EE|nr:nuclease-related domain-containing protein [Cryobacterium psychrophilum]TDW29352.1 nuclease-like protein [Cryobacterium psychrophilum]